jgi:hypothetical protein
MGVWEADILGVRGVEMDVLLGCIRAKEWLHSRGRLSTRSIMGGVSLAQGPLVVADGAAERTRAALQQFARRKISRLNC